MLKCGNVEMLTSQPFNTSTFQPLIQNMDYSKIIDAILAKEVYFHFAKSGGKWGQNVNKRETKAELYFNIQDSKYLTPEQKERLITIGAHRVHHEEKILIMTCQEERLQEANKEKVIHHFRELLTQALIIPKKRVQTKEPARVKEQVHEAKKIQSQKKQLRQKPDIKF